MEEFFWEVENGKWNLDIFFLKKLNMIKIDMTTYEVKKIVNLMNDHEGTQQVWSMGFKKERKKTKLSTFRDHKFFNIDEHNFFSIDKQFCRSKDYCLM